MASAANDCIAIGSDHGGFALKQQLKAWLGEQGYRVEDCGTLDGARCDYPEIAAAVGRKVAAGDCVRGVIIDGAGIGSAMTANKLPGVRAALCYDLSSARNSREHNDANVLTLGAGLIGTALAKQIVDVFLTTLCTEERHQRRVSMIEQVTAAGGGGSCSACADPTPKKARRKTQKKRTPRAARAAAKVGPTRWDSRSDFVLAGSGGRPHNAAAGKPERSPTRTGSDFLANSARGLRAAPTRTTGSRMETLDNLSPQDLERVMARVAKLLNSGSARGDMWCFGDVCIDGAVARQWIAAGVGRLSNGLGHGAAVGDVAGYIDHTLLKPTATRAEIEELCDEARAHSFASVCVNPYWVRVAAGKLRGSPVKVCTVVGFPLGASLSNIKAHEARRAMREGAREIDMVINIGALKGGDDKAVYEDIRAVVDACEDGRSICKVIIETALLTDEEKVRACVAAKRARADYVKTSTGFASGGATAADVALMARVVRSARMGIKASGGVRSLADLDKMVAAGATRIGASAGVKIVKEAGG